MKYLFIIPLAFALGCAKADFDQDVSTTEEQYIVVLKERTVHARMGMQANAEVKQHIVSNMLLSLTQNHGVLMQKSFSKIISAGVYKLTPKQVKEFANDPNVAYVEKDHVISINSLQNGAPWGLDRLDQANLPLDSVYDYPDANAEVNAYIIDTGVRVTHNDFGGRASHGYDFVDQDTDATDCNGHGTHVAGTVGGTEYGVAKNANIIGVRVLDCQGSGTYSGVIEGIEWVAQNHVKPAVANMSLGGPPSQAVDDAIVAAVNAGVTMVVAAGNSSTSACSTSPSRVPEAITVGSTTDADRRSSFSNYGTCVDIFAPGSDIESAWYNSDSATNTISGTSMASPHVAGVAALYLAKFPLATPAEVAQALVNGSIQNKLSDTKSGSPNLLANTNFIENPNQPNPIPPPQPIPVPSTELTNGKSVTNLVGGLHEETHFFMSIPANAKDLSIEISGGTGDADLYVMFGQEPAQDKYDCRPYKLGNSEVCRIDTPPEGTFYVMVRGYRAYQNLELKGSYSLKEDQEDCSGCFSFSGELLQRGDEAIHPNGRMYVAPDGKHQLKLSGPSSADFDLYLEKRVNGSWIVVAKSIGTTSSETIQYDGSSGEFRIRVRAYSGSGQYNLEVVRPV